MIHNTIDTKELIRLYKKGFFPMGESSFNEKINFYKPSKRFIIPIKLFHIPKKLFEEFKKENFKFKINIEFEEIIKNCSKPRKNNYDSWINQTIIKTYIKLFSEGYAKSIGCYYDNQLVGGLYGLQIGGAFFGESMFSNAKNASKLCLVFLISILKDYKFSLLDSQYYNSHLKQFGAYEITDKEYQFILKKSINSKREFPNCFEFQRSLSILQSVNHKS